VRWLSGRKRRFAKPISYDQPLAYLRQSLRFPAGKLSIALLSRVVPNLRLLTRSLHNLLHLGGSANHERDLGRATRSSGCLLKLAVARADGAVMVLSIPSERPLTLLSSDGEFVATSKGPCSVAGYITVAVREVSSFTLRGR
jgi:hypothetical protein